MLGFNSFNSFNSFKEIIERKNKVVLNDFLLSSMEDDEDSLNEAEFYKGYYEARNVAEAANYYDNLVKELKLKM